MFGPCFVMQYLVSFLVLRERETERDRQREAQRERESWLLCVLSVVLLLLFCLVLMVSWLGLWSLILAFPDHKYILQAIFVLK